MSTSPSRRARPGRSTGPRSLKVMGDSAGGTVDHADPVPDRSISFTWRGTSFRAPPLREWPASTYEYMADSMHYPELVRAVFGDATYQRIHDAPGATVGDVIEFVQAFQAATAREARAHAQARAAERAAAAQLAQPAPAAKTVQDLLVTGLVTFLSSLAAALKPVGEKVLRDPTEYAQSLEVAPTVESEEAASAAEEVPDAD